MSRTRDGYGVAGVARGSGSRRRRPGADLGDGRAKTMKSVELGESISRETDGTASEEKREAIAHLFQSEITRHDRNLRNSES